MILTMNSPSVKTARVESGAIGLVWKPRKRRQPTKKVAAGKLLPAATFVRPCSATALREHRRRGLILLLGQTNLRRLSVVPLKRHVRRLYTEMSVRDLLQIVIAGLDPKMHRIERVGEAHRDAHVVSIDL